MSRWVAAWLCSLLLCVMPAMSAESPATNNGWFSTLKRPDSPNHWLVAPADFVHKPDTVAPEFVLPAQRLREQFIAMLRDTPRVEVVAQSADFLHAVSTTALFRYQDDVRVQFIALSPERSTLAIYSASRVGYSDLGTNRRRIEDWLLRLQRLTVR